MSYFQKFAISVVIDILDFFAGRLLGIGMIGDALAGVVAVILWGPAGVIAFWELADPSEQIDGFVPTLTLIAISQFGNRRAVKEKPQS